MKKRHVARHGDHSMRSYLSMERRHNGVLIRCFPDTRDMERNPNPMFSDPLMGGHSPATWHALWQLYHKLPTDEHQRALLPSSLRDGSKILIGRTDVITVATQSMGGEYGVSVFIGKEPLYFELFNELYKALEMDAAAEPEYDARRLQPA